MREVIALAAGPTTKRELNLNPALVAACWRRPRATVIPSDRGKQQASDSRCRTNRLELGRTRKVNYRDIAVVESYFSNLTNCVRREACLQYSRSQKYPTKICHFRIQVAVRVT